jgi:hypothetical protein
MSAVGKIDRAALIAQATAAANRHQQPTPPS